MPIRVDLLALEPNIPGQARLAVKKWRGASEKLELDILEFAVFPGDTLLLCSDGLYQSMSADALGAALSLPSTQLALERLFRQALKGPARDNLSAVVIRR